QERQLQVRDRAFAVQDRVPQRRLRSMSQRSFARLAVPAAALAILFALGLGAFLLLQKEEGKPEESTGGFREEAQQAGIDFEMKFLPGEQGEKFKINLYDHGCGVAVGDFDGDGYDDLYFVNQLGPNKLYRNNGDGTFTDVTKKAGVGLGDRVCVAA